MSGHARQAPGVVMLCDLAGSTALFSRLDPENLREVLGPYHAAALRFLPGSTATSRNIWATEC